MGGTVIHYRMRGTSWHELLTAGLEAGYHVLGERKLLGPMRVDKYLETMLPVVEPDRGVPLPHRLAYGTQRLGIVAPAEAIQEMTGLIWQQVSPLMQVDPQLWPLLPPMQRAQVKTALVSNTPWDTPGKWLIPDMERLGLDRYMDEFVFSGDVGKRKPDHAIFERALRILRVKPEDAVYVGEDLRADIAPAFEMGMGTVWLQHGPAVPGIRPHVTISELAQLPRAIADLLEL